MPYLANYINFKFYCLILKMLSAASTQDTKSLQSRSNDWQSKHAMTFGKSFSEPKKGESTLSVLDDELCKAIDAEDSSPLALLPNKTTS